MGTRQAIILMCLLGLGAGLLPDSLIAKVGDNVTFTTSLNSTETPFISITWKTGPKNIITSNTGNYSDPEYEGRITLFISTGSLELRNVALSDNGEYRLTIIPVGAQMVGVTTLQVSEPVSKPRVTVSSSELVEFNSSVTLSCSASGSSLSFLWLNVSTEVTASDRVHLTDGGATLTITTVGRYDQGPFRCNVSNPVSSSISDPEQLSINYGPYNLTVTVGNYLHVGQFLLAFCSVESKPVTYTWMFKENTLSGSSLLHKHSVDESDHGTYTCVASNSITGKSLQAEHKLTVRGKPLLPGEIVGIVLGLMVLEGIAFGIGIYCICKKKERKENNEANGNSGQKKRKP